MNIFALATDKQYEFKYFNSSVAFVKMVGQYTRFITVFITFFSYLLAYDDQSYIQDPLDIKS